MEARLKVRMAIERLGVPNLPATWRNRAEIFDRYAPAAAAAFRDCAAELELELRAAPADVVTYREASLIGGYSVDHLQRMVAAGTITNMGRRGAPRIRRTDVPCKPGHGGAPLPGPAGADQLSVRRRIVADAQAHKGA